MPRQSAAYSPEKRTAAVAYLRTSSATNVLGDSQGRQRSAIAEYAERAGLEVVAEFRDMAVSGADPLDAREGFAALLAHAQEAGIGVILVENASRFARDLIVQETGYALLRGLGLSLVATDDPDAFTADTPTARLVRQVLGAVSEFEKAALVAKLKGARDRASAVAGRRVEGRKGVAVLRPEVVKEAKRLARKSPRTGAALSLRDVASELAKLGHLSENGTTFTATAVARMLGRA